MTAGDTHFRKPLLRHVYDRFEDVHISIHLGNFIHRKCDLTCDSAREKKKKNMLLAKLRTTHQPERQDKILWHSQISDGFSIPRPALRLLLLTSTSVLQVYIGLPMIIPNLAALRPFRLFWAVLHEGSNITKNGVVKVWSHPILSSIF